MTGTKIKDVDTVTAEKSVGMANSLSDPSRTLVSGLDEMNF